MIYDKSINYFYKALISNKGHYPKSWLKRDCFWESCISTYIISVIYYKHDILEKN